MAKLLTVKAIKATKPGPSRREIADGGLPGLYFIVQPTGVMSWAVRYRFDGRPRKHTIGPYPAFGLAEARKAASAALRAVSEGRDPADEKKISRDARTAEHNMIDYILDLFVQRHVEPKNRETSAAESKRIIEAELKSRWKGRQIQTITRREIINLVDEIADRGAPVMANRVLALLRKFFNWAIERDIIHASPAANVKAPAVEVSRDRVLSADEIRLVWKASERIGWPFGTMTQLLLLTGQRREEVSGADRSEFDLDALEWNIPRERAKNNKGHMVPLAPSSVALVQGAPFVGKSTLLLTTNGASSISGFSRAKIKLDAEMLSVALSEAKTRGEPLDGVSITPWRVHDLRRTAASGMASLGIPVHVVEAVLNHKSGSIRGVAATYNRYSYADEKRRALNAWANLVASIVEDKPAGNVIPLGRASA